MLCPADVWQELVITRLCWSETAQSLLWLRDCWTSHYRSLPSVLLLAGRTGIIQSFLPREDWAINMSASFINNDYPPSLSFFSSLFRYVQNTLGLQQKSICPFLLCITEAGHNLHLFPSPTFISLIVVLPALKRPIKQTSFSYFNKFKHWHFLAL